MEGRRRGGGGIYRLGFVGMPGCTNHAPAGAPALVRLRQQAFLPQQAGGLSLTTVMEQQYLQLLFSNVVGQQQK